MGTNVAYSWVFKMQKQMQEQEARAPKRLLVEEPRCRVCRDPEIRRMVNELLSWRGAPIRMGARYREVSYADILDHLNATLPEDKEISYTSLLNHAKRHYDANAAVGWWCSKLEKELMAALAGLLEGAVAQNHHGE